MLTALGLLLCLLPFLAAFLLGLWLLDKTQARAPYDHDKETPPPGWDPRTAETRPHAKPAPRVYPCETCGKPISDGQAAVYNLRTDTVQHVACRLSKAVAP